MVCRHARRYDQNSSPIVPKALNNLPPSPVLLLQPSLHLVQWLGKHGLKHVKKKVFEAGLGDLDDLWKLQGLEEMITSVPGLQGTSLTCSNSGCWPTYTSHLSSSSPPPRLPNSRLLRTYLFSVWCLCSLVFVLSSPFSRLCSPQY